MSAVVAKLLPSLLVANLILGGDVELTPITKSFIPSGERLKLDVDIPPSWVNKIPAVSVSSISSVSASNLILALPVDCICNFSLGFVVPIPTLVPLISIVTPLVEPK